MKKKKPLRFYVAMAVGKVSAIFLRMFGRRASHFPGACALQICRDFLSYLEKPNHFICVTGTNGKTTTSNLLASLLRSMGYRVTNNSFGSNIKEGVVSALMLNSTLLGVHKNEYAVIEVDERSSIRIFPEMQPDYLLCTNIMRDSIMRNAHPDFISFVINSSISENTMLILNADDFICAAIAPQCRRRFYFGISADQPAENKKYGAKDVVYCPKCGQRLIADYLRFEHIGRWRCSNCDCQSPLPDYEVDNIDRKTRHFTVKWANGNLQLRLINDNIVNVYNFCAAVAMLDLLKIPKANIAESFDKNEIVKHRFEKIHAGNLDITMIMAKGLNSVAVESVFRYISSCEDAHKCLLILLDDKEYNTRDSEISCWLYDLDYSPLCSPEIDCIIFAGERCMDHRLRAAMSGIDMRKVKIVSEMKNSSKLIDLSLYRNVYILYSAYRIEDAAREKKKLIKRGNAR